MDIMKIKIKMRYLLLMNSEEVYQKIIDTFNEYMIKEMFVSFI